MFGAQTFAQIKTGVKQKHGRQTPPHQGKQSYWAVQVKLLTPLTFTRHHLSPLAAFTSGAYFLHNGMRWQRICDFYTANFKGIFGGPVVIMCLAISNNLMPQNSFCLWTCDLLVSQKTTQRHFISTLHPLSTVIFANCNSIGICTASWF